MVFWEHEQAPNVVQRRPWATRGWYASMLSWLEGQLASLGYQAREVEQLAVIAADKSFVYNFTP